LVLVSGVANAFAWFETTRNPVRIVTNYDFSSSLNAGEPVAGPAARGKGPAAGVFAGVWLVWLG
jgi:hypothetical protein